MAEDKERFESLTGIEQDVQSLNELSMQWRVILAGFRTPCQRLHEATLI
jgi:hypothetical protein